MIRDVHMSAAGVFQKHLSGVFIRTVKTSMYDNNAWTLAMT